MKATLLREIDRAQVAVLTMRGEIRLARRREQDRCEHLASAMAQTDRLISQLETLTALVEQQKE